MSTKTRRPFVVRGININSKPFNCLGRMEDISSFTEVTVERQHDAVAEMLTNSTISSMSARKLTARHDLQTLTGAIPRPDDVREVYVIDLVIVTTASSVETLRPLRSNVRTILKTWAEKSRVANRRGWRANAVKTPTYEFDKSLNTVVIRTQVILSTAIFYDDDLSAVNVNFDHASEMEDLGSLHRELSRVAQTFGYYSHLKYRHSVIGDGEVV